jgi:hypothetical protein
MLWIIGGLGALYGVYLALIIWFGPIDQLVAQLRAGMNQEQLNQLGNVNLVQLLRIFATIIGAIGLLISTLMLVLAGFVRRGSRGAAVTAIVTLSLIAVVSVLVILVGLIQALTVTPFALFGALVWLVVALAVGLTIFWLVQSLRGTTAAAHHQIQAAYLKLQQQQAALQQPGYGYGTPPGWTQQPAGPQQALGPLPAPPGESPTPGGP